jgi:hypothetical protein
LLLVGIVRGFLPVLLGDPSGFKSGNVAFSVEHVYGRKDIQCMCSRTYCTTVRTEYSILPTQASRVPVEGLNRGSHSVLI